VQFVPAEGHRVVATDDAFVDQQDTSVWTCQQVFNLRFYWNILVNNCRCICVVRPINGIGACFHPGKDWLVKMGFTEAKYGCVEMYDVAEHLASRHLWGVGGILVHEYSHAFHHKAMENGYDNADIVQMFDTAMQKGLYDSVAVHGRQGVNGPRRAYACSNCMEFFAELSVAYHWAQDSETEYNKWFPFNRAQLKTHDTSTFEILDRIWGKFRDPAEPESSSVAVSTD
jgi:hypothetical protein